MAKTATGDRKMIRERAERCVDRAIDEQRLSPLRRGEWIQRFEEDPDLAEKVVDNLGRGAVVDA